MTETEIETYIAGVREAIDREDGSLPSAVGIIIGAASMCWEHVDRAGVFQPDRASALIDLLLSYTGPFEDDHACGHTTRLWGDEFGTCIEPSGHSMPHRNTEGTTWQPTEAASSSPETGQ